MKVQTWFAAGVLAATGLFAQAPARTVESYLASAKTAAGTDWAGTFLRLCIAPAPAPAGAAAAKGAEKGAAKGKGAAPAAAKGKAAPPRENWYAEPAKVADNLYFLGTKSHSSWALVGSEGIIIIESLFEYATQDEVLDGMKKLGLDAKRVKYVVLSHGHGDHDGGTKLLQDSIPGVRIVYGLEDWDLIENQNRPGGKVKRDLVGDDGTRLSVGDASLRIVTMPGHTAGTLSYLFEIKDNGKPLRVAYSGGTAIPFNGTTEYYDRYIASAQKLAKAAADYGATVLLSNHTEFDNAYFKAHTAASGRKPGDPNPFEVGAAGVARYFTVVTDCTTAARIRATGK